MIAAMKAKDAARTSTLRMLKSAIIIVRSKRVARWSDEELAKLLRSQVKQTARFRRSNTRKEVARIWLKKKPPKLLSLKATCRKPPQSKRLSRPLRLRWRKPAPPR